MKSKQSQEAEGDCKDFKNGKLTVRNQGEIRSELKKWESDSKKLRRNTVKPGKMGK